MSDLIRREDALEAIVDERTHTILQAWINVKNTVPSVDAIEVVRCKECDMSEVYQSDSNGVMARYCKAFTPTRMIADDDYCSYGERKSDE